jgi:hypothetical protein
MLSERPHRSLCVALLLLLSACTDAPLDAPPGNPLPSELAETAWFPLPPNEEPILCSDDYFDPVCDDDDGCTIDACLYAICRHGPTWVEGCCNVDGDCDDDIPCTEDFCTADNLCTNVDLGIEDCCYKHVDCAEGGPWDDGEPTTIDYCLNNQCEHTLPTCYCECVTGCDLPVDDDGNPCTLELCEDCVMKHQWIAGCCVAVDDCNDKNPFTLDECIENACISTELGNCYTSEECDDADPCTYDECANAQCRHSTPPGYGDCCFNDADCEDDYYCTSEYCNTDTNTCVVALIPLDPPCCEVDAQCDDGDPNTVDYCGAGGKCAYLNLFCVPGSCNDFNPCTYDFCDIEIAMCHYSAGKPCCNTDKVCQSNGLCQPAHCNLQTGLCEQLDFYNCCETDIDCAAGGAWDDGDDCTWDICLFNECRHIKLDDGC